MKSDYLSSEDLGEKDFSTMSDSIIVDAAAEMVKQLDLGSGSTNTLKLYDLLKVYLKNIDSRMKINEILTISYDQENDRSIDIIKSRTTIDSYIELLKRFTTEFENKILDKDKLFIKSDEMKKYMDRLFYLYSMMVNDLM